MKAKGTRTGVGYCGMRVCGGSKGAWVRQVRIMQGIILFNGTMQ